MKTSYDNTLLTSDMYDNTLLTSDMYQTIEPFRP